VPTTGSDNGAAVSVGSGATLSLGGDNTIASLALAGGTLSGAGTLSTATVTSSGSSALQSAVNAATSLTVTGGTLTLGADLTSPVVAINAGTLATNADDRIGDGAAVSVGSGATLSLGGDNTVASLALSGGTLSGAGTLSTATVTSSGSSALQAAVGATTSLTVTGGTLTLSAALTSPVAAINAGTLATTTDDLIDNATAVSIGSGATLSLGGDDTVASLTLAGGTLSGAGTLSTATVTSSGSSALQAAVGATTSLTVTGGTLTLSAALTSPVVAINAGTLATTTDDLIDNATAVSVGSGATLSIGGDDSIGALTLAGGTIAGTGALSAATLGSSGSSSLLTTVNVAGASNVTAGTLRLGTAGVFNPTGVFTVASGATYQVDRGGAVSVGGIAGAGTLRISQGAVTLGGASPSLAAVVVDGGSLTLAPDSGDRIGNGTALTVNAGSIFALGNDDETVGTLSIAGTLLAGQRLSATSYTLRSGALVNGNLGPGTIDATGNATLNSNAQATAVLVRSGQTLSLGPDADLAGGATVTVEDTATLTLGGDDSINTLVLAGRLNGGATLGVSTLTANGPAAALEGAVSVGGSATVVSGLLTVGDGNDTGSLTFTGGATLTVADGATLAYDFAQPRTLSQNVLGTGTLRHTGTGTLTLDAVAGSISALQVTGNGGNFVLANGGGGNRIANGAAVTVGPNATFTTGNQSETVGSLSLTGTLAGASTLTAATYTLLPGAQVNASLGGGALTASGSGTATLNASAGVGAVEVENGSTLVLTAGSDLGNNTDVDVLTGGTLILGRNDTVRTLALGGTLDGAFTLTAGNGTTLSEDGLIAATSLVAGGTLTTTGEAVLAGRYTGALVQITSGGLLRLSADVIPGGHIANTANVDIAAGGTLQLDIDETINQLSGAGSGNILGPGLLTTAIFELNNTSFNGNLTTGTLISNGVSRINNATITVSGTATVNSGTLTVGNGNNNGVLNAAGGIVVNAGAVLAYSRNGTIAIPATITGGGTLRQTGGNSGTGELQLTGTASTAFVDVAGGTLSLAVGNNDRLSDSAVMTVASGTTLRLDNAGETIGMLELAGTLAGTGTLTAGTYRLQGGSSVNAPLGLGTIEVTGASTLNRAAAAGVVDIIAGGALTLGAAGSLSPLADVRLLASTSTLTLSSDLAVRSLDAGGQLVGTGLTLSTTQPIVLRSGAQIGANVESDVLQVLGNASLGGTASALSVDIDAGTLTLLAPQGLAGGATVDIAGGAGLTLGGDQAVATLLSAGTLGGSGTLSASTYTLDGATVAVNLGSGALTSSGSTTLAGTAAAQTVQVLAGSLTLQSPARLAAGAAVSVDSGATLALGGNEAVASATIAGTLAGPAHTLTASSLITLDTGAQIDANLGAGVLRVQGDATLTGQAASTTLDVLAGTLSLASAGRFTASPDAAVEGGLVLAGAEALGLLSGSGVITLGGGPLTLAGVGNSTYSGGIAGNGSLVRDGVGVQELVGSSSYTGATAVEGGTLWLSGTQVLPAGTALTVGAAGTLRLNGTQSVADVTLAGTYEGAGTLQAPTYTLLAGSRIEAGLGAGAITTAGAGVIEFFATASADTVTVEAGSTLALGPAAALGNGAALTVAGTLQLGGPLQAQSLALSGTLDGSDLTLTATGGYTLGTGANVLANLGLGTLTVVGTATLTGTAGAGTVAINAGILSLNGLNRLDAAADVTLTSGATLAIGAFDTTVGSFTSAGTLAGTATLFAGSYTLLDGAQVQADLGGGALRVLGDLTLAGESAATAIEVVAGTLTLASANRLLPTATVQVDAGAALALGGDQSLAQLLLAGNLSGTGTLTAPLVELDGATVDASLGSGELRSRGTSLLRANSAADLLVVESGSLQLDGGGLLLASPALQLAGGVLILGGSETVSALAGAGDVAIATGLLTVAPSTDQTYAGSISGPGGLRLLGPAALNLAGSHSYTGPTDILGGTLALLAPERLADTAAVSVASGAVLSLAGDDTIATLTLAGTLAGSGTLTAATYTLDGATVLADLGTGLLRVLGSSTLSGTAAVGLLEIDAGTLTLAGADRLGASPLATLATGSTLALQGDTTLGLLAGNGTVDLGSATLTTGSGGDAVFAGVITGSGGLVKQGGSAFTLAGDSTYTGITRISGGSLLLSGSLASPTLFVDAGTLALQGPDRLADTAALSVASGAVLSLMGNDTIGTLALAGTLSGSGTLTAATYALDGAAVLANLGSGSLSSRGTTTLTGTAAAGTVQVLDGTLALQAADRLADAAAVSVASGAVLSLAGDDTIATLTLAGTLAGSGTLTAATYTLDGADVLADLGTGLLRVLGSSTLSGTAAVGLLEIDAGTLTLAGADRLGASPLATLATGSTLALQGDTTLGLLAGNGTVDLGSATLTTGSGGDAVFAGVITGSGGLVKQGGSAFTLAGDSTYTGITRISGGSLLLSGSLASPTLFVDAGTLALQGPDRLADTAALSVASGAVLSLMGNDTIGTLALAGTLSGSGTLTAATYALDGAAVLANLGSGSLSSRGTTTLTGTAAAGTVQVLDGTLALQAADRLADAAAVSVASGAVLSLAGDDTIATLTLAGTLAGSGTLTAATYTLDGADVLADLGTGLLRVLGSSTLSGTAAVGLLEIDAGTLTLAGADRLGASPLATLATGSTLALQGDTTLGLLAGNGTVDLGSATLTTGSGGDAVFAGVITGSGGLVKQGGSAFTLAGDSTYTGITRISGGSLLLSGSLASPTLFVDAGTLALQGPDRLADTAALSVASGAVLSLMGNDTIGTLALAGTLSGSGTLTAATYALDGAAVLANLGSGSLSSRGTTTLTGTAAAGTVQVLDGTLALQAADRLADAAAVSVASGAVLSLAGDDTIATLTLAGTLAGSGTLTAATYTLDGAAVLADLGTGAITTRGDTTLTGTAAAGSVQVQAGTLALQAAERLADTTTVTVASGASLDLAGDETIGALTLEGTLAGSGTLTALSYTLDGAAVQADLGTGTLRVLGDALLSGVAAVGSLELEGGRLTLAGADRLSAAPRTRIDAGAALGLAGTNTLGALSGAGVIELGSFTLRTGSDTDARFDGVITGSGGVDKIGVGSLRLAGSHTYTGPTRVDAGTLIVGDGGNQGSLASDRFELTGRLVFDRADTVDLAAAVSGIGSLEHAGSGQLRLLGGNKTHSGSTRIGAGELLTVGPGQLSATSAIVGDDPASRLTLDGAETVAAMDFAGTLSLTQALTASGDLLLRGPVLASGPSLVLQAQAIEALHPGNRWAESLSLQASGVVAIAAGQQDGQRLDLRLGAVDLAAGGRIEAARLTLGDLLLLRGGALLLEADAAGTPTMPSEELLGRRVVSVQLSFAETVISQSEGARIEVLPDAQLALVATGEGSIDLSAADNRFLGGVSARSGAQDAPWSAKIQPTPLPGLGAPVGVQSQVRIVGETIVIGTPGIEADVVFLQADRLTTPADSVIAARLPFDEAVGSAESWPGLTLSLTEPAFGLPDAFGQLGGSEIRVDVGSLAWGNRSDLPFNAGFVTVLPRDGARGSTAVVLTGPAVGVGGYAFFFDGAGSQTEIPVFYNGLLPLTPEVQSSISAIASVSENARRERFDEAVRTENVALRLRAGVIAEVGPGRPATEGAAGAAPPPQCAPGPGLVCEGAP
jgi:autotransporter-associated beta strand protein